MVLIHSSSKTNHHYHSSLRRCCCSSCSFGSSTNRTADCSSKRKTTTLLRRFVVPMLLLIGFLLYVWFLQNLLLLDNSHHHHDVYRNIRKDQPTFPRLEEERTKTTTTIMKTRTTTTKAQRPVQSVVDPPPKATTTTTTTTMSGGGSNKMMKLSTTIINNTSTTTTTTDDIVETNWLAKVPLDQPNHQLPQWMVDYFQWHRQQRDLLTAENWNQTVSTNASSSTSSSSGHQYQFEFLIMRCFQEDLICGGTSDRLQSFPFQLLMAYQSKRILMIYWERPYPLEEFLVPPNSTSTTTNGGLDWRVPSYMKQYIQSSNVKHDPAIAFAPNLVKKLSSISTTKGRPQIIWTRDQTHNHGKSQYNQYHEVLYNKTNGSNNQYFELQFHDIWRQVFTPVPAITKQIIYWMNQLQLQPGNYVSTHIRALYGISNTNRSTEQLIEWTYNAIHCATQLYAEGPIFVASDSTIVQQIAIEYGKQQQLPIVSRIHTQEPIHLEVSPTIVDNNNPLPRNLLQPSDYYDIFVDLYLLGSCRALTYNVGGYGKLGLLLGYNATAGFQHQYGGVPWKEGITKVRISKCNLKRSSTNYSSLV